MNRVSLIRPLFSLFLLLFAIHNAKAQQTNDSLVTSLPLVAITEDSFEATSTVDPTTVPSESADSESSETTVPSEPADSEPSDTNAHAIFSDPPSNYDEYSEEQPSPPDLIPHSEHEDSTEISKPLYNPGEWSKHAKNKQVLEFVPTKLYAQVRGTHTVKRLPQQEAISSAQTAEEKENAPRLREVVTNSKVNTVYTEEGYEDSAYDHAGHVRDADFHEGFARKLREQVDVKEKGKGNSKKREQFKTASSELQEFDDDYSDHFETTTEVERSITATESSPTYNELLTPEVNPKLVVEQGIEKLQEDLEREAEEIERGLEINKLRATSSEEDQKSKSSEPQKSRETNYQTRDDPLPRKTRRRPSSNSRNANLKRRVTQSSNINVVTTPRIVQTDPPEQETTQVPDFFSTTSKDDLETTDASTEDSLRNYEEQTTENYSQLFWDYFKSQQKDPTTTEQSFIERSTTPFFAQTPFSVNGPGPYTIHPEEQTTAFPETIEPETLRPARLISQSIGQTSETNLNKDDESPGKSDYSPSENENDSWRPVALSPYDEISPLSENVDESQEASDYGSNSVPDSNKDRRPPYKVLVRPKSKKPVKYVISSNEDDGLSENYLKVLMYVRNKDAHFPRTPPHAENELDDLTRLRPPLPQKAIEFSYPGFFPDRGRLRSVDQSWKDFPQDQRFVPSNGLFQSKRPDPFTIIQPTIYERSLPSTVLLPPGPHSGSDYARYQTAMENEDYLMPAGSSVMQNRNLVRHVRYSMPVALDVIRSFRALRRGRRFVSGDETGDGSVKGDQTTNNGLTNRGKIERAEKNANAGRNSPRKATRTNGGPDLSRVMFAIEKKSRYETSGRSVDGERESDTIDSDNGARSGQKNDGKTFESGFAKNRQPVGRGSKVEESNKNSRKTKRSLRDGLGVDSKSGKGGRKSHEELLNGAPEIAEDVIEKEIKARFNGKENKKDTEVEVDFDYVDEVSEEEDERTTTENSLENNLNPKMNLDSRKYPFYANEKIPSASPLKYALDPRRVPKKTAGGMEFYDSRDAYMRCDDVEPDLEKIPEKEEPVADRGPNENLPRLAGLGDKLDCFKAKYFDENPFDNPLFSEQRIEEPTEWTNAWISSRIMRLPEDDIRRPWKPETDQRRRSKNRKRGPRTGNGEGRFQGARKGAVQNSRRIKPEKWRPLRAESSPYQSQVYEDVMGNIRKAKRGYEVTTVPPEVANPTEVSIIEGTRGGNAEVASVAETATDSYDAASIEGLVPPRWSDRYAAYGRNRKGKKGRVRKSPRIVARYRMVQIKKRSVREVSENREDSATAETVKVPLRESVSFGTLNEAAKGRTESPRNVSGDEPRTVYTIRDRIRHSKPKEEAQHVGKFAANETANEDHRRKEPRYNSIKRKRPQNSNSTSSDESESLRQAKPANATNAGSQSEKRRHFVEESRKKTKTPEKPEKYSGSADCTTERSDEKSKENQENATIESSSEKPTTQSSSLENSKDDSASVKESEGGNSGSEEANRQKNAPSRTESSESGSEEDSSQEWKGSSPFGDPARMKESKEKESDEDTFFRYTSRPLSPPENYEDDEYTALGPRVNKPAFYHPPFSVSSYKNARNENSDSSRDSEDSGTVEKDEEFGFPWRRDEKRNRYGTLGRFEFPWERRERLAREEKTRSRRGRFNYDEEEVPIRRRNVYPWKRFDAFKSYRDKWSHSDNEDSGTEHRPTKRFSSRYNSRNVRLLPEKSRRVSSTESISRAVKAFLEDDSDVSRSSRTSEETSSERTASIFQRNREATRGIVPEDVTLAPRRKDEEVRDAKSVEKISKLKLMESRERGEEESSTVGYDLGKLEISVKGTGNDDDELKNFMKEANSTRQFNKRRRKPSTDSTPTVATTRPTLLTSMSPEPVTSTRPVPVTSTRPPLKTSTRPVVASPRKRGRQRFSTTTSATISSNASKAFRTTPSRVARRKLQKPAEDPRGNSSRATSEIKLKDSKDSTAKNPTSESKLRSHKNNATEISSPKDGTKEHVTRASQLEEKFENATRKPSGVAKNQRQSDKSFRGGQRKSLEIVTDDGTIEKSSSETIGLKDDDVKRLNNFGTFDRLPDDDDFGIALKPENIANILLQSVALQPAKDSGIDETKIKRFTRRPEESYEQTNENVTDAQQKETDATDKKEKEEVKLPPKFIKNPEDRLYYYVERRR